jgi:hypothetical protein
MYRVDTEKGLQRLVGEKAFRGRRWTPNSYPHKSLKKIHGGINNSSAIYRICFFHTFDSAKSCFEKDLRSDGAILRCEKSDVTSLGFIEEWDDGFDSNVAYLFHKQECLDAGNKDFSHAGIGLEKFQVHISGIWRPLTEHAAFQPKKASTIEVQQTTPVKKW